ncbi:hypothetical protein LNV09_12350 [Paucibacter sp. B2R-40]|uniref:ATP-binding protein n=1 Tax=Paucibacter sp. B2R-40 TaxID=2893554 RepID=UPI0021E4DDB0|nr:ATP-binding protein [Paucibacter sp. B2R-40]MCV2354946.1 hypothetical protein [Paucibacter sp. B2R-40]
MPISRLSVSLIMAVCVGTLLLSSVMHIWYEARGAREALGDELSSIAALLGNRSTAAIAFDDSKTAQENLAALQAVKHVNSACLYGDAGELFASFSRRHDQACPVHVASDEQVLTSQADALRVRYAIQLDDQKLALLVIESSLDAVHQRIWYQVKLQGGVVLLAALLALGVAMRMQGLISKPLAELSAVANEIVVRRDYALRAGEMGPLELMDLARSFNLLIHTIEQQNVELEAGRRAALARFERARSYQMALSSLAKSAAANDADVEALAQLAAATFAQLLALSCVSVCMQAEHAEQSESAQQESPPLALAVFCDGALLAPAGSCSAAAAAGLAAWRLGGERYVQVNDVAHETRLSRSQVADLSAQGTHSFLWVAAGSSQSAQLSFVCLEQRGARRHWSSDEIAVAGELADLLALVERDSRRRRAERLLRSSNAYNKLLFRESCLPQGVLDPQTMRFVDCNRVAVEVFGFSQAQQLLGLTPAEVAPLQQADGELSASLLEQRIAAALAGELSVFEMQFLRAGQPPWDAEVHLDRFDSETATLVQFSLIDISTRVQAQRAMASLNQDLELRVARRTAALSDANQQLSETLDTLQKTKDELVRNERLGSLGALVAGVAHELNTPIGNSLVVASTLQDGAGSLAMEVEAGTVRRSSMTSYLEMARESSALLMRNLHRAAELVSRFKQIAGDQTSGQRRQFELRSTVEELVETLQPQFRVTPHQLVAEIPAGIVMDSWPGDLERVLVQLVGNTLVHAHQLEKAGCTVISATLYDAGQRVQLVVADNGQGIDPKSLPRIFDPFFTTRLGSGGNGLGLHTVFSLVTKSLGGRVSVESAPGAGCKFTLDLPCVAPQASQYRDFPH